MKTAFAGCAALALLSSCFGAREDLRRSVRSNIGGDRILRVAHSELSGAATGLRAQLESSGADVFGSHALGLEMRVSAETAAQLQNAGVQIEDRTEHWINHFEENFADPQFFCDDAAEACAKRDLQSFYSSYQSLDAVHARLDDLAAASNGLATIGSIGTSYQGRNLKSISIGDQSKPLVYYGCNIHAREWLTIMYCTYMAEMLLANGGHPLLNTFSFTIVPSQNPDGYVYSTTTDNMWRKTRKPNSGSSCVGTDGNRNYAIGFGGSGASSNKCDETYHGVSAFDQPETIAIKTFAEANAARLIATNDVHSYSQLWMCPSGYTETLPPAADFNKMQQCNAAAAAGIKSVNGLTFDYGPVATTIYLAAGGAVDYFYETIGVIYAYTVELRGTSFQPAASNIMPSNQEIFAGMVASLNCVASIELGVTSPPTTVPPTTATTPTAFPTPFPGSAPSSWTCNTAYYNAADGCDCACGDVDPDCSLPNQQLYGCSTGRVCVNGVCSTVPSGWTCNSAYYAAVDGCDCNCGVPDPDCSITGQTIYGCSSGQKCVNGVCQNSFM